MQATLRIDEARAQQQQQVGEAAEGDRQWEAGRSPALAGLSRGSKTAQMAARSVEEPN